MFIHSLTPSFMFFPLSHLRSRKLEGIIFYFYKGRGFMKCDKGTILVNGKQIGKEIDFPDHLGVIIETPGFIPNFFHFIIFHSFTKFPSKSFGAASIKSCTWSYRYG